MVVRTQRGTSDRACSLLLAPTKARPLASLTPRSLPSSFCHHQQQDLECRTILAILNSHLDISQIRVMLNRALKMIQATAVCSGIYGLSVSTGNQFSTDYSVTVGPILMISTADPHEIPIPIKC